MNKSQTKEQFFWWRKWSQRSEYIIIGQYDFMKMLQKTLEDEGP